MTSHAIAKMSPYLTVWLRHIFFVFTIISPGLVDSLQYLASHLELPVYGLQSTADVPQSSIEDMAAFYVQVSLYFVHCNLPTTTKDTKSGCCRAVKYFYIL